MAFNITHAKDTVYTFNGFGALGALQRFNYSYTANENFTDEIGNDEHAATTTEPQTTLSFELTDTGTLAALLARLHYNFSTQDYTAGVDLDLDSNAFSFDQNDVENLIFTCGEYKAPDTVFSEAKLFPYHFLTSLAIRLDAEGEGSVTLDAQGSLFQPVYTPYHTTRAYPIQYATTTTATINAGWNVNSGTHQVLAVEIDNQIFYTGIAWSAATTVTLSNGEEFSADSRLMLWAFERTPGSLPTIDYINAIRFIKADRINIWLQPEGTTLDDTNNMLRVQSVDLTIDISREELREICKNETGSSVFFRSTNFPLDISAQIRVLETSLHTWAELQGKTLNEAATTGTVDFDNVLNTNDWVDAVLMIEWYKYGSDSPVQRVTCSGVRITGYDGVQEVRSRKEATWNLTMDQFVVEGFDVA